MISFFVPGRPQAQGSKVKTQWGMREANKELGPWRERVALEAFKHCDGLMFPAGVPVALRLEFVLYRPASAPKTKTPPATKKPDADKMARSICDALTQVVWHDDAQVTSLWVSKRVAEPGEGPGVYVWVAEAENTSSNPRVT